MEYQTLVKNLFNDMFVFLNGKEALGILALQEVYQNEPLFLEMIGNLDQALAISFNQAMTDAYAFYKRNAAGDFSENYWDRVIQEIKEFNQKWENAWCRNMILALLELLEEEAKQLKTGGQQGVRASEKNDVQKEESEEMEEAA